MRACLPLLSVSLLLALGCAEEGDPTTPPLYPVDFAATYTEVRDCRPTNDHGFGSFIRVYANPEAAAAYTAGSYPFAVGTTLVKGIYVDERCTELESVSAMKKVGAAENSASAWEWQETAPSGAPLADRKKLCTSCHTSCTEGRDMACTDP